MTCNKNQYVSEEEAKTDAEFIIKSNRQGKHRIRTNKLHAYDCPHCEFWHLTGMSPNKQRTYKRMERRG